MKSYVGSSMFNWKFNFSHNHSNITFTKSIKTTDPKIRLGGFSCRNQIYFYSNYVFNYLKSIQTIFK